MEAEVLCACGCGKPVGRALQNFPKRGYKKGDYFLYARGHKGYHPAWNKGLYLKEPAHRPHASSRARSIKGKGPCEIEHIGGCKGRMEIHHLDGNPYNNDLSNLMRLCISHHGLVENGRIDLDNPVMPRYHVSGGKRRYEHTYAYPGWFPPQ